MTDTKSSANSVAAIDIDGANKLLRGRTRNRILLTMLAFSVSFAIISTRLVALGLTPSPERIRYLHPQDAIAAARPDILDRNGEIIATDIKTASLYAEPKKIGNIDEVVEKLTKALPMLDARDVHAKLAKGSEFVWIKRELTPRQQAQVHNLGLPGLRFLSEKRRFYPTGDLLAHVIGHVDVDSHGIAGMERAIDDAGLGALHQVGLARGEDLQSVRLSIDVRVQHVLNAELSRAMETYSAIAATGVLINVHTGEIVASSSLPGYDPHRPAQGLEALRLNRASAGVFEFGSVFKVFNTAIALDSGHVNLNQRFDASAPITMSGFTINDSHPRRMAMTVPEVFLYSSNIGSARMALAYGIEAQKTYFSSLGLSKRLALELPERAAPLLPQRWDKLTSMTLAFGHGISVTPIQVASATAALVNGGYYVQPTLKPRSEIEAKSLAVPVVSEHTSDVIRALMRLNAVIGTGKRARVAGYRVGGKTGTAEKVVNGRYSKTKKLTSFLSIFPAEMPHFVLLVVLDEPRQGELKPGELTREYVTGGTTAAPTTARVVERIAPMLGITPKFEKAPTALGRLMGDQNKGHND